MLEFKSINLGDYQKINSLLDNNSSKASSKNSPKIPKKSNNSPGKVSKKFTSALINIKVPVLSPINSKKDSNISISSPYTNKSSNDNENLNEFLRRRDSTILVNQIDSNIKNINFTMIKDTIILIKKKIKKRIANPNPKFKKYNKSTMIKQSQFELKLKQDINNVKDDLIKDDDENKICTILDSKYKFKLL